MSYQTFCRRSTLFVLMLLATAATARADIVFTGDALYRGETTVLTLSEPADTILVTYRPNSSLVVTDTLFTRGERSVRWTPTQAGIVALTSSAGESKTVSVRYRRAPASGIVVLLLAGMILFGGASLAMRSMLARE